MAGTGGAGAGADRDYLTMEELEVEGRTVLLRVDINSPLDRSTLELTSTARIRSIEPTLRQLLRRQARAVILAHQGRKGDWDFCSLERHAAAARRELGVELSFVPDLMGRRAREAIEALRPGEALMLENVRGWDGETAKKPAEEHARSELVSALAPLADFFVLDAFAAAHRAHASIVGFPQVLPSAAGLLLDAEVAAMTRVFRSPRRPFTVVLGGAKFSDATTLISHLLSSGTADRVLLTGLVPMPFLKAMGRRLGGPTEALLEGEGEAVEAADRILRSHGDRVVLPSGFAADDGGRRREVGVEELPVELPLLDICSRTAGRFAELIRDSGTVFISGPAGLFERPPFDTGTAVVLRAVAGSGAFRVAGGGHTTSAIERLGLRPGFDYISTGGGALEEFILGKKLPGLEALRAARERLGAGARR
ncbi:MAG: phosphoglycerate kinase [Thermoplasmatota archaeon]